MSYAEGEMGAITIWLTRGRSSERRKTRSEHGGSRRDLIDDVGLWALHRESPMKGRRMDISCLCWRTCTSSIDPT